MVLCLLSRDSHGDTGKLNHEETVRGPEIAIFPEKSEILLLILVKILKKRDSIHSSSPPGRAGLCPRPGRRGGWVPMDPSTCSCLFVRSFPICSFAI